LVSKVVQGFVASDLSVIALLILGLTTPSHENGFELPDETRSRSPDILTALLISAAIGVETMDCVERFPSIKLTVWNGNYCMDRVES
jgi:hypothetical protein